MSERDADLGSGAQGESGYVYGYHALNIRHGFRHLPARRRFSHVLGVGSAYGAEFQPIIDRLDTVTILEPSDQLTGRAIGGRISPAYVKPNPSGMMPFDDGCFDLTVSMSVLHHIPNVSRVVAEMSRVTKRDGYTLIREPIVSMGDWRYQRKPGVTKRERGIPLQSWNLDRSRCGVYYSVLVSGVQLPCHTPRW